MMGGNEFESHIYMSSPHHPLIKYIIEYIYDQLIMFPPVY